MRASFGLPLLLLCGLLLSPALAQEGPGAFTLPGFGDAEFLSVPTTDRLRFESSTPLGDTHIDFFPGTGVIRRVDSGGGLRLAWRRGDEQVQAIADSLLYSRTPPFTTNESPRAVPGAGDIERFQLIGNVVVVTPEGRIDASTVTVVSTPDPAQPAGRVVLELEAHGDLTATMSRQAIRADRVRLRTERTARSGGDSIQTGQVEGNVVLTFAVDADLGATEVPAAMTRSLLFDGVDLTPQSIRIEGPRFRFTYDRAGLQTVAAEAPSLLTLQRADPVDMDDTPTAMTIETPLFEATFEPEATSPGEAASLLRTFQAPAGIMIRYLGGTIEAGYGDLDLGPSTQSLSLREGVTAEQGGATMLAEELSLRFDPAGLITLAATGRPTFFFETARFAPLASVLGQLRPGGVSP